MSNVVSAKTRLKEVWIKVYARRMNEMGYAPAVRWAMHQYGPANEALIRASATIESNRNY